VIRKGAASARLYLLDRRVVGDVNTLIAIAKRGLDSWEDGQTTQIIDGSASRMDREGWAVALVLSGGGGVWCDWAAC